MAGQRHDVQRAPLRRRRLRLTPGAGPRPRASTQPATTPASAPHHSMNTRVPRNRRRASSPARSAHTAAIPAGPRRGRTGSSVDPGRDRDRAHAGPADRARLRPARAQGDPAPGQQAQHADGERDQSLQHAQPAQVQRQVHLPHPAVIGRSPQAACRRRPVPRAAATSASRARSWSRNGSVADRRARCGHTPARMERLGPGHPGAGLTSATNAGWRGSPSGTPWTRAAGLGVAAPGEVARGVDHVQAQVQRLRRGVELQRQHLAEVTTIDSTCRARWCPSTRGPRR